MPRGKVRRVPVLIRVERPEDAAAIRRVHGAAFGRELEARIVDDLRAAGDLLTALSLVAEGDGEIVGHVAISRARLEERPALALGPIGVLPDRQREGIGSALMHETIERAGAAGEDVVVLLGHADYYPRFGFIRASRLGIVPPFDVLDEAFMALELRTDGAGGGGRFAYPPAFEASVD
jgi:putative acetyltransferase